MGRKGSKEKDAAFKSALQGKKIPVLTLDNKWYRLLNEIGKETVKEQETQLNKLLQRQGKLNTESKDIKRLKKQLMNEIMPMVEEAEQTSSKSLDKRIQEHKRLIEECNEKLENYQDELREIPYEIDKVNNRLMLTTMDYCYDTMQSNEEEIQRIADWVTEVRIELKKQLIRKQEMEQKNQEIYSYMHDIFGADVVDLFDMKYNSNEQSEKK